MKGSIQKRLTEAAHAEGKVSTVLLIIHIAYSFVAATIYLLFSPWISWSQLPFPDWSRWFGVGLGVGSLPFLIWVHRTLGKHWSRSLELQQDHELVTRGPYRWIRHPMYTIHTVHSIALVVVSANLFILIFFPFTILLFFTRIPKEEAMLLEQFGEKYRAYMKRTGRLLPRFQRRTETPKDKENTE